MNDIDRILEFWLEPKPRTVEETAARWRYWFTSSDSVDRDIRERFGALVEKARRGELEAWTATPRGTLALLILIDQFSRNLYRGTPDAFSADERALAIARAGFASNRFSEFDVIDNLFAALPFRHAENVEAQRVALDIAQRDALRGTPALKQFLVDSVEYARKHYDVIARFGRFPHRNATLGRPTTTEETEYLAFLAFAGQWL
jgi:uncharacterized protein (DUF924 family)